MSANSEREALVAAESLLRQWDNHDGGSYFDYAHNWIRARNALRTLVAARRRGPVTDAEARAAGYALYAAECAHQGIKPPFAAHETGWSDVNWMRTARTALEAARAVE